MVTISEEAQLEYCAEVERKRRGRGSKNKKEREKREVVVGTAIQNMWPASVFDFFLCMCVLSQLLQWFILQMHNSLV